MAEKLAVLDLFSGIGGFSLGLERTGGFETVAFCEIEEFPRSVLAKHWPEVICFQDVKELTKEALEQNGIDRVDIITGGFPCQDLSITGKKEGIGIGTRSGLFSEIIRLSSELRPRYVLMENVANLLSGPTEQRGGWFGTVLGALASIGYDAEWENIPAAALGAPHRRERVWIVAYPAQERSPSILQGRHNPQGYERWQVNDAPVLSHDFRSDGRAEDSYGIRSDDGFSRVMDRLGACGNAVIPHIPEMIGKAILDHESAYR
jgi:DNA (cytosine-5)-methyltransferase 1